MLGEGRWSGLAPKPRRHPRVRRSTIAGCCPSRTDVECDDQSVSILSRVDDGDCARADPRFGFEPGYAWIFQRLFLSGSARHSGARWHSLRRHRGAVDRRTSGRRCGCRLTYALGGGGWRRAQRRAVPAWPRTWRQLHGHGLPGVTLVSARAGRRRCRGSFRPA